jgi:hypothetical protein
MRATLFAAALDEAIKCGPQGRLVLTFPGNEDAMHLHPLAYSKLDGGFRIEIRVSDYVDSEMVDDVIFLDADAVETVELQVKPKGKVWTDEPFESAEEEDDDMDR